MRARPRTVIACLFALSCAVALGAAVSLRDSLRAAYLVVRIDLSRDVEAQREWLAELLVLSPSAALPRIFRWVFAEHEERRPMRPPDGFFIEWEPWDSVENVVVPSRHTDDSLRRLAAAVDGSSTEDAAAALIVLRCLRDRFPDAERILARHLRSNPDRRLQATVARLFAQHGIVLLDSVPILFEALLAPDPDAEYGRAASAEECLSGILDDRPDEASAGDDRSASRRAIRDAVVLRVEQNIGEIVKHLGRPIDDGPDFSGLVDALIGESAVVHGAVVRQARSTDAACRLTVAELLASLVARGDGAELASLEATAELMRLEDDLDPEVRRVACEALAAIKREQQDRVRRPRRESPFD